MLDSEKPSKGQGRCVLMIAYNWPPDSSVGAVRPVKVLSELQARGWSPVVVTVNSRYHTQQDPKLVEQIAAIPTYRTTACMSFPELMVALRTRLTGWMGGKADAGTRQHASPAPVEPSVPSSSWKRWIISLCYLPDQHIGWLPFAVMQAWRTAWRHNAVCIVSTGPPFTAHLAALCTKMLARLPWVADFRDPWARSETRPVEYTSRLSTWLNEWLEWVVIRVANQVVSVTPSMTEWYRARYGSLGTRHWATISNGFVAAEFRDLPKQPQPKDFFTVSYVGSIEYQRSPELVFAALAQLRQEGAVALNRIRLRFIGKCHDVAGTPMTQLVAQYGLQENVVMVSAVPRQQALQEMTQAHVLLLLASHQRMQVPGKAYEYIGAGRYIVTITEADSATAAVIRQVGGAVVEPGNLAEMKAVLLRRFREFEQCEGQEGHASNMRAGAQAFEWESLGRQYGELLNAVCTREDRGGQGGVVS